MMEMLTAALLLAVPALALTVIIRFVTKIAELEEENSRLRDLIRDFNIPDRDIRGRFTKRRPF